MSDPAPDGVDAASPPDPLSEFHARFDWRVAMRAYRRKVKLSQAEVAARASLSVAAVRAYESGARHPTLDALNAMVNALGMPPEAATPIRTGAGYAADLRYLVYGKYAPRETADQQTEVDRYPWPVAVTSQSGEIVVANPAFDAMWGPRLSSVMRGDPDKRNLMALISDARFADRTENWDEAATFMIGLVKGDPRTEHNLESPPPSAQETTRKFLAGDPRYITRVLMKWEATPPTQHWTRHTYRFHFRAEDGRLMRFWALNHVADIWSELFWCDYIPQDAETWQVLADAANAGR